MSLVVTELPNYRGDPDDAVLVALRGDTLVFGVRGGVDGFGNLLYFFVRDAAGSDQWAVQSLPVPQGGLVTLGDSRAVVGGGELGTGFGYANVLRRNHELNRWEFEAQLLRSPNSSTPTAQGVPAGGSISGDAIVLRTYQSGFIGAKIFARQQGGHNAWGRIAFLQPAVPSSQINLGLEIAISGDTVAIAAPADDVVLILVSDVDRDGLRDGIDACPRDPQNNVAGGCTRDGSAYLVLDDLISLDDVATATQGNEFHITGTFTNTSETAISNPFFEVTELSGSNMLVNADGGPGGIGSTLSPDVGDGILSPGESTTVTFVIGLETHEAFRFHVSVKGEPRP